MLMARKETNKAVKKETKKTVKKEVQKPEENQVFISEADQYVFGQGTHYDIYKKLGAHPAEVNGEKGVYLQYGRPMPKTYAWSENSTAGFGRI